MTALFGIVIPPALSACLWNKLNHKKVEARFWLASYGISLLCLYFLCNIFLALVLGYSDSAVRLMNTDFSFALKYFALASGFALIAPLILFILTRKSRFKSSSQKSKSFAHWWGALCLLALVLFGLTASMGLGNTFWCDEIFTIKMVNRTPGEIIRNTATDVHPPLYYLCSWLLVQLFGTSPLVYRLASLVPYAFVLVLALTFIYRELGKEAAAILIVFSSLLSTSVRYNLEARMYALGAFFVLLGFYQLRQILIKNRPVHYVLFCLACLSAAYTQYYALIAVAFFYVTLLCYALRHKKYLKSTLITYGVTVAVYLPWLLVLLNTLAKSVGDHWQKFIPDLSLCLKYMFGEEIEGVVLFSVSSCLVLWVTLRRIGVLQLKEDTTGRQDVYFDFKNIHFTAENVWVLAGLASILGVCLFGVGISKLLRPFMLTRYMLLVAGVSWLLVGWAVSQSKHKSRWCAFLLVLVLMFSGPKFANRIYTNYENEQKLTLTLSQTQQLKQSDVILLNTIVLHQFGLLDYYYGEINDVFVTAETLPKLEEDKNYWLLCEASAEAELEESFAAQNASLLPVIEDGVIGSGSAWLYKIQIK